MESELAHLGSRRQYEKAECSLIRLRSLSGEKRDQPISEKVSWPWKREGKEKKG